MRWLWIYQKTDTPHRVTTILFVFMTLAIFLSFMKVSQAQNLSQADEAYGDGNYQTAIDLYEIELNEGNISGELYFNLANAYYLEGFTGKALQNYLRAQQYLPRNRVIEQQINIIRTERVDGIQIETDWVIIAHDVTAEHLTLTETTLLVFVVWVIFFVIFAWALRKRGWLVAVGIISVVMAISLGLLGTRLYIESQRPQAVIIAETTQVMSGPSETYLPLFSLYEGIDLRVLDSRDGWVRFTLPDGREGWIRASSLGYIPNDLG